MTALAWLVPAALLLGGLGLAAFLWSLRSGQFDDLEGAGWRAIADEPLVREPTDAVAAPPEIQKPAGNLTGKPTR